MATATASSTGTVKVRPSDIEGTPSPRPGNSASKDLVLAAFSSRLPLSDNTSVHPGRVIVHTGTESTGLIPGNGQGGVERRFHQGGSREKPRCDYCSTAGVPAWGRPKLRGGWEDEVVWNWVEIKGLLIQRRRLFNNLGVGRVEWDHQFVPRSEQES